MTQDHPITPPPELLSRWEEDWHHAKVKHIDLEDHIATQAARWGADEELKACRFWVRANISIPEGEELHAARRPKPPSLKEQALGALGRFNSNAHTQADEMTQDFATIRRALEALDD